MKFSEKVKKMSAKEIILAMVEGLKNPKTEINMMTYGHISTHNSNVCFGCAATNTICVIGNINPLEYLNLHETGAGFKDTKLSTDYKEREFICQFENAINDLRKGEIQSYNFIARDIEISLIENKNVKLPKLYNDYTKEQLKEYEDFANSLK